MTVEARDILMREAQIRAPMTAYRDLSIKTGLSEEYIANFVGRLIRGIRDKVEISVPRVTEKVDIDALARELGAK